MASDTTSSKGFLQRCVDASSSGTAWITLGIVFFVLGITRRSGAFIGLGAAFLAIGLRRKTRNR